MICYRDMTYCPFFATCKEGATCRRALTPTVNEEARRWARYEIGIDYVPICTFASRPVCYEGKHGKETTTNA